MLVQFTSSCGGVPWLPASVGWEQQPLTTVKGCRGLTHSLSCYFKQQAVSPPPPLPQDNRLHPHLLRETSEAPPCLSLPHLQSSPLFQLLSLSLIFPNMTAITLSQIVLVTYECAYIFQLFRLLCTNYIYFPPVTY